MPDYDDDWTDDQRGLYDECYSIGHAWATDQDTSADDLQQVLNLAEADEDDLGDVELDYPRWSTRWPRPPGKPSPASPPTARTPPSVASWTAPATAQPKTSSASDHFS